MGQLGAMDITRHMSTDKLFEDFPRQHQGFADHIEGTFSFLNRSARPASERVRNILNEWYSRYPNQHKSELKRKFHSDFSVGFFELLLYELLLRLEHRVDIHPNLGSDKRTHPDFRAHTSGGDILFLEAAVVTDESEEENARNKVLSVLYDQISQMNFPDYYLDIDRIHNPTGRQPSGKKIRHFISQCVKNLDYEALLVLSQLGTIHDLPRWTYKEDKIEIEFGIIPVSKEKRGRDDHRPIGIYPGGFRWGGSDRAIRDKIAKKAGRYGQLGTAYIIALNCLGGFDTSMRDQIRALFGDEEPLFVPSGGDVKLSGKVNAAWYGPKGAKNKRVSAVLLTRVFPWNLPIAEVNLFHNPWADFPYEGPLTQFPRVLLSGNKLISFPGKSFGSILSLENDWPGQLFEN